MAKSKLKLLATSPRKTSLKHRLRQSLVFKSTRIRIRKHSVFGKRKSASKEPIIQRQQTPTDPIVDTPQATPARSHLPTCSMNVTQHQPHFLLPTHASSNSCIALQHHTSGDDQDMVIISTLPGFPFCCHEDLLHMSEGQLMQVANVLNDRLPAALTISTEGVPAKEIRHAIELVVGIRHSARLPPSQTPLNTPARVSPSKSVPASVSYESYESGQSLEHSYPVYDPSSPPISPIDRHGNPLLRMYSPNCLSRLEERDEEELSEFSSSPRLQSDISGDLSSNSPLRSGTAPASSPLKVDNGLWGRERSLIKDASMPQFSLYEDADFDGNDDPFTPRSSALASYEDDSPSSRLPSPGLDFYSVTMDPLSSPCPRPSNPTPNRALSKTLAAFNVSPFPAAQSPSLHSPKAPELLEHGSATRRGPMTRSMRALASKASSSLGSGDEAGAE